MKDNEFASCNSILWLLTVMGRLANFAKEKLKILKKKNPPSE
jgi:hypothetical protein